MDWDRLRIFNAVAEAGSVTHAGEILHLSQSAVSRQIQSLEDEMGATLFHRHPRGLLLTSEGEILYEATQHITGQLNDAALRLRDSREGVHGPLRITTTVDFGVLWLTPRLPRFLARHPGLSVELSMTEKILDLPMREADVAVRMRPPRQADVITKQLWKSWVGLYASANYLETHGTPQTLADLEAHTLIRFDPKAEQPTLEMDWLFRDPNTSLRPKVTMSSQFAVFEAARHGVGIGILPDYLVAHAEGLRQVLSETQGPAISPHLVYAREMKNSKRVAVFKAFLIEELSIDTA